MLAQSTELKDKHHSAEHGYEERTRDLQPQNGHIAFDEIDHPVGRDYDHMDCPSQGKSNQQQLTHQYGHCKSEPPRGSGRRCSFSSVHGQLF
jgi:hypothetical protein